MDTDDLEEINLKEALIKTIPEKECIKKQHYVPDFFMRQFANESGLVWVYNRKYKKVYPKNPRKICKQMHLYETKWENASTLLGEFVLYNELEKMFGNKESQWAILMRRLLKQFAIYNDTGAYGLVCSRNDKNALIDFYLCTYFRNPAGMSDVIDYYASLDVEKDKEIVESAQRIRGMFENWGFGSAESLLRHSIKLMMFNPELQGSPISVYTREFQQMNMCFLCSLSKRFILSSFPTQFMMGTEGKYQHYLLPISPNVSLHFSNDPFFRNKRNRFVDINDEMVSQINSRYLDYGEEVAEILIAREKTDFP